MTRLLVERGYLDRPTSVFDIRVRRAVEGFQARHIGPNGRPLSVDGRVGPLVWWALRTPNNSSLLVAPSTRPTMPSGGTPIGRAALRAALREMEAGAKEVGKNDSGRFVKKYLNEVVPPPANWSAGFVSWCFSQTPHGIPYEYSLGARDIRQQFKKKGWTYHPDEMVPEPGDIVVWWRGQRESWMGHIGFVLRVEHGVLHTVEGNKGGFPAPVNTFDYVLGRMEKLIGFGRAQAS